MSGCNMICESEEERIEAAYKEGYLQALQDYAVWKDGTQIVGCGIKTLKQAQEDFEKDLH